MDKQLEEHIMRDEKRLDRIEEKIDRPALVQMVRNHHIEISTHLLLELLQFDLLYHGAKLTQNYLRWS